MRLKETISKIKKDYGSNTLYYVCLGYALLIYILLAINMEFSPEEGTFGVILKLSTIFIVPIYASAVSLIYLMDVSFLSMARDWLKEAKNSFSNTILMLTTIVLSFLVFSIIFYEMHYIVFWLPIKAVLKGFGYDL